MGRERLADQRVLPFASQRAGVSIASAQHHPSKLGGHQKRVVEDVGRDVVAINENGHAAVDVAG